MLNGTLDVRAALRALPPARVDAMQQAIGRYAWRLHYAREEGVGPQPDAAERVWRALHARATADLAAADAARAREAAAGATPLRQAGGGDDDASPTLDESFL